jgi:hypothetical protein
MFRKFLLSLLLICSLATGANQFKQAVNVQNTTVSTSTTTGSITTAGGVGIAGACFVGGEANVTGAITNGALTASRLLTTNGSKVFTSGSATDTEAGYLSGVTSSLCGISQSCTLTNKTVDVSANTFTNIVNSNIGAAAAIDFSKLATLASTNILVGSAGAVATSRTVTGDVTINNTGVTAIGATKVTAAMMNSGAATSGQVATADGGGGVSYTAVPSSPDQSYELSNLSLQEGTSVAAASLTMSVRVQNGTSDPTAGASVKVGMRSSTAATGSYSQRTITGSNNITLEPGYRGGVTTAAAQLYWYLFDSDGAGAMKLGASNLLFEDGALVSTVVISQRCTVTIASPGVWTCSAAHGFNNTDPVRITTAGTLPTGVVTATTYYVREATATTFQLAATPEGSVINTSGSQTSTHAIHSDGMRIASDSLYSSKPVRLIGRGTYTKSGTTPQGGSYWAVATQLSLVPFAGRRSKTVSAHIANAGTPSVSSQSEPFIMSITDNGVGDMTFNFPVGFWSAAPNCVMIPDQTTGQAYYQAGTATAVQIRCLNATGAAAADYALHLICNGSY